MRKVSDWDTRPEMNKHVIDWMCKKWDDWDAKSKMNVKNSKVLILSEMR